MDYNANIGENCPALEKMIENIYQSTKVKAKMCIFQNNVGVLININKDCNDVEEKNIVKFMNMETNSI